MTTAQVVEMSVTVNNNSPIHLDDQTQPTFEMTPGFKPFTERLCQQGALLTDKLLIHLIMMAALCFFQNHTDCDFMPSMIRSRATRNTMPSLVAKLIKLRW